MTSSPVSASPDVRVIQSSLETTPKPTANRAAERKPESGSPASVNVGMEDVYKSLTVLGDEIIKKLDEMLANELPGGIASLKPEDHTPERTAERIVQGVVGLFSAYGTQNPDLEDEELIDGFMAEARKGIQQGYEEARGMLEAIGALDFGNVQSGIEETMRLVDEKLKAFEDNFLEGILQPKESAGEPAPAEPAE